MSPRATARPGGRSARVQQAVHAAVRELQAEQAAEAAQLGSPTAQSGSGEATGAAEPVRADLTVPQIAARAGVTPSTVYRRWGDLQELLSDVAVERLRPESPPADLGSLREDLDHWAADFLEEMSSPPGRSYIRDALSGDPDGGNAGRCSAYAVEQVDTILTRARARGEHIPDTEIVMDHVVAPMMYRILFRPGLLDAQYAHDLVATVFYRLMPLP